MTHKEYYKHKIMAAVEVRNGFKYYGSARDPHKKIVLDQLDMNVLPGSM